MKPLDRFLLLETARPAEADGDEAAHSHRMSERFAAMTAELPAEVAPAEVADVPPPVERDPFAPPPEDDRALELAPRDLAVARGTIRCVDCGLENARYAHDVCGRCGAPLDTKPAQQLNAQLWQDERAAAVEAKRAAEAAAVAAMKARAAEDPEPEIAAAPSRPLIDRAADLVARGPAASWPPLARRALVVALVVGTLAVLYRVTDYGPFAFLLAMAVTLGLCLLVA